MQGWNVMRDDSGRPALSKPQRLPPRPTRLIGREQELHAVCALVLRPDIRLLTITGPPGVGKTRLAVEIAFLLTAEFAHGTAFVDLSSTRDPASLLFTLLQQLGVQEVAERTTTADSPVKERLKEFLQEKRLLVILDNFEQVVTAAPVIGDLLEACSRLKIAATSRIPLRLLWEQEFPLNPLIVNETATSPTRRDFMQSPASMLFVERARALKPDFALTKNNAPLIAQICARLDGLPLAIELAAAHTRHLPLPALLERLERRLELLTGGRQDLPERQRTLRSALAWSFDLLAPGEQALFRQLCAFAGGFSLEAAGAVCVGAVPDVFGGLAGLTDKNLVRQAGSNGREPRFEILESLREFGLEQLASAGEEDTVHNRHLAFFLTLVEDAVPGLKRHEQLDWLARLDTEQDNIRTALAWALSHQKNEAALRMAYALETYWLLRARFGEGLAWLERGLSSAREIDATVRANSLCTMGVLLQSGGDLHRARQVLDESLRLARQQDNKRAIADVLKHQMTMAAALTGRSTVAAFEGDRHAADLLREETLALYRALGDSNGVGVILSRWGWAFASRGRLDEAEKMLDEALSIGRQTGDRYILAIAYNGRSLVATMRRDLEAAHRLQEKRLSLSRELGHVSGMISSLNNLGAVAMEKGNYAAAKRYLDEALTSARDVSDWNNLWNTLENLGEVEEVQGHFRQAATHYTEYLRLCERMGVRLGALPLEVAAGVGVALRSPDQAARLLGAAEKRRDETQNPPLAYVMQDRLREQRLKMLRQALGEERMKAAWAAGRAMPFEQALAEARKILEEAVVADDPRPPARTLQGQLSRREEEVAALVAQGLSNRGIAKRLFISERTADTHIQNILNKLGFSSRAQIAAWTIEHGIAVSSSDQ